MYLVVVRPGVWRALGVGIVLTAMVSGAPLPAQEPILLPAQPVSVTVKFEAEGLPNRFEDGANPPAAMLTAGDGDTRVTCLAYSPSGATLAVGDGPTRSICTFLGDAPVNQNGGLIRIVDPDTRRVTRTIRPVKQTRHEYEIVGLAYTPDGRTLVAHEKEVWPKEEGGLEVGYHLIVWDTATGRELRRIDAVKLDDWQFPILSRDASTFLALTHEGIRVWDVASGRQLPAPIEAPLKPSVLALSHDAKTLAAGESSGEIGLWEVATGRRIARFPGHRKYGNVFKVKFLVFSPDGRTLACGGQFSLEVNPPFWEYTSELRVIDLPTHADRLTIPVAEKHMIGSMTFSPDGKTIAATTQAMSDDVDARGLLKIWDTATAQERVTLVIANPATHISYTADGARLITASREWIEFRDPANGRERASLYQGGSIARDEVLALSPDGRTLASSSGSLQLWDLRAAATSPTVGGHRFRTTCVAYAPDGLMLASGSFDRTVKLWDIATRRPMLTLVGHSVRVVRVAYAPDGRTVASVDADCQIRIWDTATGACRVTFQGFKALPQLLAFGPDGRTLCLIAKRFDRPDEICRWDVSTGGRLPSPPRAADESEPLALSADGGLYVCSHKSKIEVRDVATGALRSEFSARDESQGLLVSRDGATVFQMTTDFSIVAYRRTEGIWKSEDLFASKDDLIIISGSDIDGSRMNTSPDGRRLAVNSEGMIRFFDTATHQMRIKAPSAGESITWLAFSPDGHSLATGRSNGEILIYDSNKITAPVIGH